MNPTFELTRLIAVRRYDLVAKIACEEERPELKPVLLWARQESKGKRPLKAEALAAHLLGPGSGMVTVAKRLLSLCLDLKLITEDKARLTDHGNQAASSGKVLLPDKGEWSIWAAEDPLLPFPIIGVKPRTEDAAKAGGRRPGDSPQRAAKLPKWILAAQGKDASMLLDGRLARFDEISTPANTVECTDSLTIRWTIGERQSLRVTGKLDDRPRIDHAIDAGALPSAEKVWAQLLDSKQLTGAWNRERSALQTSFEALKNDDERNNMRIALRFESPTIDKCGRFSDLTVDEVALMPNSQQAAAQWSRHQLEAQLREYQTKRRYTELTQQVQARFPDWKVDLPDREQLAQQIEKRSKSSQRPRSFWALKAALDWNL